MKVDWTPLHSELLLWRRSGVPLPLWWRDDDAVAATPALERLADLAVDTDLPIHVAVIPGAITASLPVMIQQRPSLIPVIHGWQHINHAPAGAKKAEFGHARPHALTELERSLHCMQQQFDARLINMFVPPWNRISPVFTAELARLNYSSISTYGPREKTHAMKGLIQINTHIDPIFWRDTRGLVDPEILLNSIVKTLQDRRQGRADIEEPLGLLTHHLVHTEEVWAFSRDLICMLLDGGAIPADIRSLVVAK